MVFGTPLDAPRIRTDGAKVIIDVGLEDADDLRDYLRRHDVRTTAYLDVLNEEARLALWDRDDLDHVRAVIKGWSR
jgi:hypothetical protein